MCFPENIQFYLLHLQYSLVHSLSYNFMTDFIIFIFEWPILRHQDWQWGVCNRLGVGGNEIRVNLILVVGPWVNELTFCASISHLWNECNILSPTRWLWRLTKVHTQTPAWRLAGARQLCQPKGMQRAERSTDPQSPVHWPSEPSPLTLRAQSTDPQSPVHWPSKPVQVVRLASGLGWLRG